MKGFDDAIWEQSRLDIVVRANEAKFSQNQALRDYLPTTGDRVLVEASPVDRIWGIGVAANDERALEPSAWCGLNQCRDSHDPTLGISLGQRPSEHRLTTRGTSVSVKLELSEIRSIQHETLARRLPWPGRTAFMSVRHQGWRVLGQGVPAASMR